MPSIEKSLDKMVRGCGVKKICLCNIRMVLYSKALPDLSNPSEESYVAVSGRPGQRTVHVVNGRGGDFAGTGTSPARFEKHFL